MSKNCKEIENDLCGNITSNTENICRLFLISSFICVVSNNKDILTNNKNSRYLGLSGTAFCTNSKKFENYSIKAEGLTTYGNVPFVHTSLNDNFGDSVYQLQTDLPLNERQESISFSRAVTQICFNKLKNTDIKIIIGVNSFFSHDINYEFRGGWYKQNYRTYLGDGNIQNVQNIPLMLDGVGIQLNYNTNNLLLYCDIINDNKEATESIKSNGFVTKNNKNLIDFGLTYKTKKFLKSIFNIHFQKYICGLKTLPNTLPSLTNRSFLNLKESLKYKDNLNSCSILGVSQIPQKIEISGALSGINIQNKSNNGRLLMWSLGLLLKCKQLKCFSNIIPPISYGLNLATPLYVDKTIIKDGNTQSNFSYVLEANFFTNIDGFILPIFFSIMHLPEIPENNSQKIFIFGCRPYYIQDSSENKIWRGKCKCNVERSLD